VALAADPAAAGPDLPFEQYIDQARASFIGMSASDDWSNLVAEGHRAPGGAAPHLTKEYAVLSAAAEKLLCNRTGMGIAGKASRGQRWHPVIGQLAVIPPGMDGCTTEEQQWSVTMARLHDVHRLLPVAHAAACQAWAAVVRWAPAQAATVLQELEAAPLTQEALASVIVALQPLSEQAARRQRHIRHRAWRMWAARATCAAAGPAHRWTNRLARPRPADARVAEDGRLLTMPEEVHIERARTWSEVWRRPEHNEAMFGNLMIALGHKARQHQDRLPGLEVAQLRRALETLRRTRGNGLDGWHPRELLALPDEVLQHFCNLLNTIEAEGQWPVQASLAKVVFITKPNGSDRVIGLASTLGRAWLRARYHLVAAWEQKTALECDYARAGRGALIGAEDRALQAELAKLEQ